jgi:gamma-glutamyltranspeptidase/glutathione hydrolase
MNSSLAKRIGLVFGVSGLVTPLAVGAETWVADGQSMMVATDSVYASQAGLKTLKSGGNAIDAAAAVSFTLGVVRSESTGIGGGGFLIYRRAKDGQVFVLDFRETAPAAATPDMYGINEDKFGAQFSRYGGRAVGVPGNLAGMDHALKEWGTMPLGEVLQPAIDIANEGWVVDAHYVDATKEMINIFRKYRDFRRRHEFIYSFHLRMDRPRSPGNKLKNPMLGGLLQNIAEKGPDFFYEGPPAKMVVQGIKNDEGILTLDDWKSYKVKLREPIRGTYRGYEIVTMPPPSSGGVCIIQCLNILENAEPSKIHEKGPEAWAHYLVEVMKHGFADRARWMGDPDFVDVPVERLISKDYAKSLFAKIDEQKVREPADYGIAQLPNDSGTCHFSIVDKDGNCVVMTETINTTFGSLMSVKRWGLTLNNEMDDFTVNPGKPNAFGLIQSERNAIAPGKRPVSSMAPTILLKEGKPVLLLGASGGPMIISSILQVIVNVVDLGMGVDEAVAAGRVHHQWQPDIIYFDQRPSQETMTNLQGWGHPSVSKEPSTGHVQAIHLQDGKLIGVSDPRKGGQPAGE